MIPASGSSPDWSSLPYAIWNLILEKLPLEDYIRGGSVCRLWLSIVRHVKRCSSLPRTPWLVLHSAPTLRFFDISSKKVHNFVLPELFDSTILGSSEGWLIVVDNNTADLRLFNPFTRAQNQLPPTTTFPGIVRTYRNSQGAIKNYEIQTGYRLRKHNASYVSRRYFASANVISSNCGYIVVVKYNDFSHPPFEKHGVAFARAGDDAWTIFPIKLHSGMLFNGLLYAMDSNGRVLTFDLSSNINPPLAKLVSPPFPDFCPTTAYLGVLPGSGELLHIHWFSPYPAIIKTDRLDHKALEWIDASNSLDGHSLFFTDDFFLPKSMVCLAAKDLPALIKRNCMHIIKDGSISIWDMDDQELKPCSWTTENIVVSGSCALWIDPILSNLSVPGT